MSSGPTIGISLKEKGQGKDPDPLVFVQPLL